MVVEKGWSGGLNAQETIDAITHHDDHFDGQRDVGIEVFRACREIERNKRKNEPGSVVTHNTQQNKRTGGGTYWHTGRK